MQNLTQSIPLFIVAGLCEIGGGWLVWQYWRSGRSIAFGLAGAIALILYGIVPTYQTPSFGRVYAAYGGVFIALALLWGWMVDGVRPDVPDVAGAIVAVAGMAIIMYWPR